MSNTKKYITNRLFMVLFQWLKVNTTMIKQKEQVD